MRLDIFEYFVDRFQPAFGAVAHFKVDVSFAVLFVASEDRIIVQMIAIIAFSPFGWPSVLEY